MKEKVYDHISENMIGKKVSLLGLVVNCKAGPCLKVKNNIIYIRELEDWPSESDFMDKKIIITGTFLKKKIIPDPQIDENGAISTGAYGEQLVLENISEIKEQK